MQRAVDAFLAYNEREKSLVEPIAQWLASQGVQTHFFARDKKYGEPIDDTDDMDSARTVLAFLGAAGWGANHQRLVERAQSLNKPVYPILIGDMDARDGDVANRLFRDIKWVDARSGNLGQLAELVPQIRRHTGRLAPEAEAAIDVLIAGPEEQRPPALERIIEQAGIEPEPIAARLRDELARGGAGTSGGSSSGPEEITSAVARSWLRVALIRCLPESPQAREIALQAMTLQAEPAEFGRFWSLAAAQRANASYLRDMAQTAAKDPEPSVSLAARAMLDPHAKQTEMDFHSAVTSESHRAIRGVLRALRIVHVPYVIPDVCALAAGENRAEVPMYDVFCALATPPAAAVAAPILRQRLGVDGVVDRVMEAAYDANRTVTQNFAELLAVMDAAESRTALHARTENSQVRAVARRLLQALDTITARRAEPYRHRPGFAADTIDGQDDQLGIQSDVQTLAAIMMARDVTPPLAIGLFGEWGSGKSFFMSRMRETVRGLANQPAQGDPSPYCSSVAQITFNAWHYSDTNLWASLVSVIFEKLAVHVLNGTPKEREQASLLTRLADARTGTDAARADEQRASEKLKGEQAKLDEMRRQRAAGEQKLANFDASYLVDLLGTDKGLKEKAEQAFQELGLPVMIEHVDDFKRAVADAGTLSNRTVALLTVLSNESRKPLYAALFLAALIVPAAGYALHHHLPTDNRLFTTIGTVVASVGTFVAAAAEMIRRGMQHVNVVMAPIMDAKKKAETKLEELRAQSSEDERVLARHVEALKTEEQEAKQRVAEAESRVAEVETRLRELEESYGLARFIADRDESADYRKHLGLMSLARLDFESLVERISKHGRRPDGTHELERIVLYIDDLDRCPASQVVDVLQAVHLLLAYPLFVVVVGVDSRWLMNSLRLHYKELGAVAASPQHYLEKIFQIPFALRPMSPEGYGKLVGQLMNGGARGAAPSAAQPVAGAPSTPAAAASPVGLPGAADPAPASPLVPSDAVTRDAGPPAVAKPAPVEERALVIHAWEEEFARRLYRLIPSPRAAKRLINVYRVLKAGVGTAQLPAFEGTEDAPGQFQVPLLLLAVQICDATVAAAWFGELMGESAHRDGTAQALARTADPARADPARARLLARVRPIIEDRDFPADPALLAHWIPLVGRFTFETLSSG